MSKEMAMRKTLSTLFGVSLLGAASIAAAADIDVMTQNQYLGADLAPVLGAAGPAEFNAAIVDALKKIAAVRPAERVQALAAGIAQRKPDVVGLQEAFKFACLPYPGDPAPAAGTGCDDPELKGAFTDHLENTRAVLHDTYVLAGKITNLQAPAIPFLYNGVRSILQVADRDALLVRRGLPWSSVDLASMTGCARSDDGCNFAIAPEVPVPGGSIAVKRGYLAVDLTVKSQSFRVFNTHLEQRLLAEGLPETRLIQVGQAQELLSAALIPMSEGRKAIVVGDFNSAPGDTIPGVPTPYQLFTLLGGFTDTWTMRPKAEEGLTCCQSETLTNRASELSERIDLIFSLARPSRVVDMKLLGATMGDKTRPPGRDGLWPSDHAAVAAKLFFD
jgi:Endonuclease/Exonuclease/phosphatase family